MNAVAFGVSPHTQYHFECWRAGVLLWTDEFPNLVTIAGRNELLNATFRSGKVANAWCVGLVNQAGFSAYAAADTMASHAGWVESTDYVQATRPTFLPDAPSGASLVNVASKAVFIMSAGPTVRGAFLVDVPVKGGSTGVLYGVGNFALPKVAVSGDIWNVTVTVSA